ncbi:MAG: hypothetical protein GX070_09880 [Alcaligenaceae bacterium]|nr:hypothetical protein [Advenella sp.]MDD3757646.1 hypothetical protein [Advenella sp.]NLY65243.1 hypothetical protein [Alcaligenaceae bacterium]
MPTHQLDNAFVVCLHPARVLVTRISNASGPNSSMPRARVLVLKVRDGHA